MLGPLRANVPETATPREFSVANLQARLVLRMASVVKSGSMSPPTEVKSAAPRRRFTAKDKERILAEAAACLHRAGRARRAVAA